MKLKYYIKFLTTNQRNQFVLTVGFIIVCTLYAIALSGSWIMVNGFPFKKQILFLTVKL